jgi:hypothetical protein
MVLRPFFSACFLAAHRIFRRAHGAMQVLFEGVWMGLLPESVSDLISEQSYGQGVACTGAAYLDSGLQFWENLIFDKYLGAGGRVLVAAACAKSLPSRAKVLQPTDLNAAGRWSPLAGRRSRRE